VTLLLMTNRKSHTRFRLVPKLTTLDDLEGPLRTVLSQLVVSGDGDDDDDNGGGGGGGGGAVVVILEDPA